MWANDMRDQTDSKFEPLERRRDRPSSPGRTAAQIEYPVREYVAAMSRELAQMARWDGDETLAVLLEAAAERAGVSI